MWNEEISVVLLQVEFYGSIILQAPGKDQFTILTMLALSAAILCVKSRRDKWTLSFNMCTILLILPYLLHQALTRGGGGDKDNFVRQKTRNHVDYYSPLPFLPLFSEGSQNLWVFTIPPRLYLYKTK